MEDEYWLLNILSPEVASVAFLFHCQYWADERYSLARSREEVKVIMVISWQPLPTDVQ